MSNFVVNIYSFVFAIAEIALADSFASSTFKESACSSIPAPLQEICSNYPITIPSPNLEIRIRRRNRVYSP